MKEKMSYLLKHYGYLILLGVCIIALIIASIFGQNKAQDVNVVSNNAKVNTNKNSSATFSLPVMNASITKSFDNVNLQYNETLKQYEAHMGMDFVASSGSYVYSVLDGVVSEVGNNYLKGNYVVVTHDNGLKSVYSSLADNVSVKQGDSVKKGSVIGAVGESAYSELNEGAHLHFELLDGDKKIDPAGYLALENK